MTSGSSTQKILDLRPYLDSRTGAHRAGFAEDEPLELLDDSPEDWSGESRSLPAEHHSPGRIALGTLAAAFAGCAALALFLPPPELLRAAPVVLGVSGAAAWMGIGMKRLPSNISTAGADRIEGLRRREKNDLVHTISALAVALEARDPYTKDHSRQVARLSVRLGRRLGLKRSELYEIHLAGLLHDIGKIGIPDEILLKPSRLTESETLIVKSHVVWSYDILSKVRGLGSVAVIARHHHERFDGAGYPDGLSGTGIPLGARVMAVADMFMAMTEDRPYRKGLPIPEAVDELHRVSGRQLDPRCVEEFLAMLAEEATYPAADDSGSKSAAAN